MKKIKIEGKLKIINIYHESIGNIALHFISIGDHKYILELLKSDIDYREFTVRVIHNQLISPKLTFDEVNSWPDFLLVYIAKEWLRNKNVIGKNINIQNKPYENFYNALIQYQEEINQKWKEVFESFQLPDFSAFKDVRFSEILKNVNEAAIYAANNLKETIGNIDYIFKGFQEQIRELSEAVTSVTSSLSNMIETSNLRDIVTGFVSSLPDPVELQKHIDDIEEAEKILENKGYGFANHLWSVSFIKEFNNIPNEVSSAVVTNKLLSVTRSKSFYKELTSLFSDSPILKERQDIINSAYKAHKDRNYLLSVPVLLTQIEGIINQMLILRGEAKLINGKFYARNTDGTLKQDKKGDPIKLTGLKWKLDHSKFKNDEILSGIANSISNKLIFQRNEILHGQSIKAIKPKLSTQCLLIIYVLSNELRYYLDS